MRAVIKRNNSLINAAIVTDIAGATYAIRDFDLAQLRDALSMGQIGSKLWLVEELLNLNIQNPRILIVGGWIGSLSRIIFEHIPTATITSVDIDEKSNVVAKYVNNAFSSRFKALTLDMYDIDSSFYSQFDIIINTSCEHIPDIQRWMSKIQNDKIVIVQSNNFFACDQHINCVSSVDEFKTQVDFDDILYEGELEFINVYTRYMLIGKRKNQQISGNL